MGGKEGKRWGWGEQGHEETWGGAREQGEGPLGRQSRSHLLSAFRQAAGSDLTRGDNRVVHYFEGLLPSLLAMDLWEGCASDSVFQEGGLTQHEAWAEARVRGPLALPGPLRLPWPAEGALGAQNIFAFWYPALPRRT